MNSWKKYESKIIADESNSIKIINLIGCLVPTYFNGLIRPERTRLIKKHLVMLGHDLGYNVYANGLSKEDLIDISPKFVNREWLFDLHWYTDGKEPYSVSSLPLIVECEWNPRRKGDGKTPYSGIKYDFQKLVISNAQLRLMIFIVKRTNELEIHSNYFNTVIQNYQHLETGSEFLFICFNIETSSCHYLTLYKD